ncbi:MAG: UPF0149 family protein [Alphaproteobacteria bacterium]|nr:UPF0149 family protein [Alphaproteobacteria bacterium]
MQLRRQFRFGIPGSLMLPTAITNMVIALERRSDHGAQADDLKRFGRALVDAPDDAVQLLNATGGITATGTHEERMTQLLAAALDEARMARENGQRRGAAFIDALEQQLSRLAGTDSLTTNGRLAVSGSWVRAGLVPPDSLASRHDRFAEVAQGMDAPEEVEVLFESLFGSLIEASQGTASAAHAMFAEMLPTVPADARYALVRIAVSRPAALFAELGCAWLLDATEEVHSAAADGLADRLAAGRLSADVIGRLTIIRSWLTDDALKGRLDVILREAMRQGIVGPQQGAVPKVHRIVASMVDGSGAQSMAAAIQSGSSRSVAVVLLKQGFGVKDAYVLPCASATEQRTVIAQISADIDACDVSRDYLAQAIGIALSEGLEKGIGPVPGLVDVARICGLTELRPGSAAVADILALADPEGRIASLPVQARGRLITASGDWEDHYPMLSSWFEDSDMTVERLDAATSRAALMRGMWGVLEARRTHWATLIARNALLLKAAGTDDADEFIAVAAALAEGRDLKKTPVMQCIVELSLEVWADRNEPNGVFGGSDQDLPYEMTSSEMPADMPMPVIRPEKKEELAKLLQRAGLTEPWLEGYLTGACTAPIFISPPDWLSPLLHLASPSLDSERQMGRFVELLMLRYNATVSNLGAPKETMLVPGEVPLLPLWADGYLTAWEANKSCWPAKALGPQGKAMRKLMEHATEGRIDRTGFTATLPAWLKQRFAEQKM